MTDPHPERSEPRAEQATPRAELPLPPASLGHGFAALRGQQPLTAALRAALASGRLAHSFLFFGPPGVGKATCATLLAQAVNCPVAGPTDACGTCPSCSKVARNIHPDVWAVAPSPREIKVDTVRELNEQIGYRPHEAMRRVLVIDDAHRMNSNAQNAFLKTLEEPPPSALIVLVTSAPAALLATVRSRCQSLRFAPLPLRVVREALEQGWGMAPDECRLRAALAPGSLGGALAVELDSYAEQLETVVDALRLVPAGGAAVVQAAESLAGLGDGDTATQKAVSALRIARDVLRDLLVVASGADPATLIHVDRLEAWRAWAAELRPEAIAEALAALMAGVDRLQGPIQRNIRLALEQTLFEVGDALAGRAAARL